jgi:hypothetical protein
MDDQGLGVQFSTEAEIVLFAASQPYSGAHQPSFQLGAIVFLLDGKAAVA